MLKNTLVLFAFATFAFTSCKKDEADPEKSPTITYKKPVATEREKIVNIPQRLNEKTVYDYNAREVTSQMKDINQLAGLYSAFAIPEKAKRIPDKNNSVGYFWTFTDDSYWTTLVEESNKFIWTLDMKYPDKPRFTYMKSEESKDGKSGNWEIFDERDGKEKVETYLWNINSKDDFTASIIVNDYTLISTFNIIDNKDGSGSFIYTYKGIKQSEVNWKADGSGSYWLLDDDDKGVTGSWI